MSEAKLPPKVFISYRRDDTSAYAGRLSENLGNYFGVDQIFMDVFSIEVGDEFPEAIEKAVTDCDLLIAVIGKQWLSSATDNGRRLDDPNDFVRKEIVTALERNIRIIPVLVQTASMPRQEDLPPVMARLANRQAIEIRDGSWKQDVESLINKITKATSKESPIVRSAPITFRGRLQKKSFAATVIATFLLLTGVAIWFWVGSRNSFSPTTSGSDPTNSPSPLTSNSGSLDLSSPDSNSARPRPTVPVVVMPGSSTTHTITRSDRIVYEGLNFAVKLDDDKPVEYGRIVLWLRYPLESNVKLTPSNYFELSRDNKLKTQRELVDVDSDHQFSLGEIGDFTVKVSKPIFVNNELQSVQVSIIKANK